MGLEPDIKNTIVETFMSGEKLKMNNFESSNIPLPFKYVLQGSKTFIYGLFTLAKFVCKNACNFMM